MNYNLRKELMNAQSDSLMGILYILHIDPPLSHAKHYLGWAKDSAEERLQKHLSGQGARIIRKAIEAGCKVTLVHQWPGTRKDEYRIKKNGHTKDHCPECNGKGK